MAAVVPVFITGVGRSGTSLVAGLLWHLGLFLGDDLQPPDEHNPQGYFEDRAFTTVHEGLIQDTMSVEQGVETLLVLLQCRMTQARPWGFKDPRLCYFAPFYRTVVPTGRWIVCVRDDQEICQSMQATYGVTAREARQLVHVKHQSLAQELRNDANVVRLAFVEVLRYPVAALETLRDAAGLPYCPARTARALAFVHRRSSALQRPLCPPRVRHQVRYSSPPVFLGDEGKCNANCDPGCH